jgi:type IV secretion system protein VirB10
VTSPQTDTGVQGERSAPVVNTVRSVHSRISSALAAFLMIALGAGALSWYYSNALSRQQRLRQAVTTAAANSAQGEMALPPLGRVDAANIATTPAAPPAGVMTPGQDTPGVPPSVSLPPGIGRASELPLEQARPSWNATGGSGPPPRQAASDRRLTGVAFSRESQQPALPAAPEGAGQEIGAGLLAARQIPVGSTGNEEGLTTLLRPSVMSSATRAQMLATQRFLLPKGAFIDCTLETAIDSTLPGMTTCVTATDTFGVDGKVVLLERGSKLVGETRGQVQNGSARVFVLWTEARTPTGVMVPLNSPGTDELGRSGMAGEVNRHFWDRFGAAMLISVIDGAVQAAAQSSTRGGGGAIIFNPSTAQDALTDVLKGTINIAPTVTKHQGDRIQILVARDLDFRPVYELRSTGF